MSSYFAATSSLQTYSLPGNICNTIRHAAHNKGAGVNADSIDLFSSLLKCSIPTITDDLQFVFDLIYKNKLPENIKRYFTDVYLFCLHKDPRDPTKLRPLGIPTAIRCLIASHVARTLRQKFANHLLPYNYVVGVPDGSDFIVKAMQLSIEKYIDNPQQTNRLPTRAAIFFDIKPIQQRCTRRIQECHRHLLPRTPTTSHTILRPTQHCPLQMERRIVALSPHGRRRKSRMPAFTSICLICGRTPTRTH